MKLYSWNVNGIRAVVNKGTFQQFIKEHDPDILCLQETKAQQGQAELDLPEYTESWYSAAKKGYSGTAIFSKVKPLSVTNGFPEDIIKQFDMSGDHYGDPNQEGRVIAAEFEDFIVATVYTPNSKGDLSRLELRHKHWDPAFLGLHEAAGREKAGAVLRRPQRCTPGNRPRKSQTKRRQTWLH
jgi:exodeoxyribonuclease-3